VVFQNPNSILQKHSTLDRVVTSGPVFYSTFVLPVSTSMPRESKRGVWARRRPRTGVGEATDNDLNMAAAWEIIAVAGYWHVYLEGCTRVHARPHVRPSLESVTRRCGAS
jgi:hypothetical protein